MARNITDAQRQVTVHFPERKINLKRLFINLILACVVIGGSVGGYYLYNEVTSTANLPKPQVPPNVVAPTTPTETPTSILPQKLEVVWKSNGPSGERSPLASVISSLHIIDREGNILIAVEYGNIWYSRDEGNSWKSIAQIPAISKLAVDPNNSNLFYVMGRQKLHRSIDGGQSWNDFPLPEVPETGWAEALFGIDKEGNLWFGGTSKEGDPWYRTYSSEAPGIPIDSMNIFYSKNEGEIWDKTTNISFWKDVKRLLVVDASQTGTYDNSGKAIDINNSNNIFVAALTSDPRLLVTLDKEKTWYEISLPANIDVKPFWPYVNVQTISNQGYLKLFMTIGSQVWQTTIPLKSPPS